MFALQISYHKEYTHRKDYIEMAVLFTEEHICNSDCGTLKCENAALYMWKGS